MVGYLTGEQPAPFCGFCAFWSLAEFVVSKSGLGQNLAVLAFGAVSLRLLGLGVPEGRVGAARLGAAEPHFEADSADARSAPPPKEGRCSRAGRQKNKP